MLVQGTHPWSDIPQGHAFEQSACGNELNYVILGVNGGVTRQVPSQLPAASFPPCIAISPLTLMKEPLNCGFNISMGKGPSNSSQIAPQLSDLPAIAHAQFLDELPCLLGAAASGRHFPTRLPPRSNLTFLLATSAKPLGSSNSWLGQAIQSAAASLSLRETICQGLGQG